LRRLAQRTHLAGLLLALAACGRSAPRPHSPPSAGGLTVTDDAGRSVTLAAPATRIVSLAPSSTELLFAIGAGERVAGRTTWCRYPPEAQRVPVVGDGLNPNIEAVAARRPDLVVLYASALNETAARQLTRLGIPAVILRQDRLEDVARDARLLGRLTGRTAGGDSVARAVESVLRVPPAAHDRRRRVAFVVWDNPLMVIGSGSFLDQLTELAGAVNTFHDLSSASATVSLEILAERDPDVIIALADSATAALPSFAARREWRVVRAIRERRIVTLPEALFGRPSPRADSAVAELRRRLESVR
jgi:iron complex transport system substrate-binding protein